MRSHVVDITANKHVGTEQSLSDSELATETRLARATFSQASQAGVRGLLERDKIALQSRGDRLVVAAQTVTEQAFSLQ